MRNNLYRMRFFSFVLSFAALFFTNRGVDSALRKTHSESCDSEKRLITSNGCVQFSVTSGTGCAWMCNYCTNQLGTNNYYFTDNVCTYQEGQGCVGNPIAGKTYTCCSV
jgi:hypothetical protein